MAALSPVATTYKEAIVSERNSNRQIAFLFKEGDGLGVELLGGKGGGLIELKKLGIPVPSYVMVSSGVSRAYLQEGHLPKRLQWQLRRTIVGNRESLEAETGRRFGDSKRPLFVSVRSGAAVSMPGMMETIPNLGMNSATLEALTHEFGSEAACNSYLAFLKKFGSLVLGVPAASFLGFDEEKNLIHRIELYRGLIESYSGRPMVDDPWQQLELAIEAVCRSWNSERAREYRSFHHIPDNLGTAIVIQAMVFGNRDERSGTGVAFSRNPSTGEHVLYGEYLKNAQGEELVSGVRTPEPMTVLEAQMPEVVSKLGSILSQLETLRREIVEIEFTVETGKLWILQVRRAKTTIEADLRYTLDSVASGEITRRDAMAAFSEEELKRLVETRLAFDEKSVRNLVASHKFFAGIAASPGIAVGVACFSTDRARELTEDGRVIILIRPDTSPDDFTAMIKSRAIVTVKGGATCHAAVVARGQMIPAVVGAQTLELLGSRAIVNVETRKWYFGKKRWYINEGDLISVDGNSGLVFPGAVPTHGSAPNQDALTVLNWIREERAPKVDFALARKEWCMNTVLNNVYLSDAVAHRLMGTESERPAREFKDSVHGEAARLISTYLVIAVAGELRHAWACLKPEEAKWLEARGIRRQSSRDDAQLLVFALKSEGQGASRIFVKIAHDAFSRGGNPLQFDGSYGGRRWALIAEAVREYLGGTIGASVFVDRAFDLRHNGGKLFNKHPMADSLTKEDTLHRQLDTKRAARNLEALTRGLRVLHTQISPELEALLKKALENRNL